MIFVSDTYSIPDGKQSLFASFDVSGAQLGRYIAAIEVYVNNEWKTCVSGTAIEDKFPITLSASIPQETAIARATLDYPGGTPIVEIGSQ